MRSSFTDSPTSKSRNFYFIHYLTDLHSKIGILLLSLACALFPFGDILSIILLTLLIIQRRAADALLMTILIVISNPSVFSPQFISNGRWLIILFFLVSNMFLMRRKFLLSSYLLLIFSTYLSWNSIFVSSVPQLSISKSLIFVVIMYVMMTSIAIDWSKFSMTMDYFIPIYTLLSLPLLFVPSLGKSLNGLGFQGLTNQPQVLGIVCCTFVVWIFHRLWLRKFTSNRKIGWATFLLLVVFIVESQSRTAILATIVGLYLIWLGNLLASKRQVLNSIALSVCVTLAGAFSVSQTSIIQDIIYKERIGGTRDSGGLSSRAILIERSIAGFNTSPLFGIGFGVSDSLDSGQYIYDPIFNIPIGSTIEKGVWITALLEELGIVGLIVFVVFLLTLYWYAIRQRKWSAVAMLSTLLVANLGEMTLFSLGATGLILWLFFWSILNERQKADH